MIRKILAAVDFSEASIRAGQYAAGTLAPQLGAEVVFVTVLDVGDLRVAMRAGLHGFESDEELRADVREWIDQQFAPLESTSAKTVREVRRGIPEREILAAVKEHAPDLMVMGAVGIARRIPMGSKAEYVLRHAEIPLLLIK